ARWGDVEAVGRETGGRGHVGPGLEYKRSKPSRHDGADLGDQIPRRPHQLRIAMLRHPLRTQHGRFDLLLCEHERRQVQPRLQYVADPGLTPDWYALADEAGDVAIDGPPRDPELGGERVRGYRFWRAPQDLDDLKKPVGGSHELVVQRY